jgi:hypothetical protein
MAGNVLSWPVQQHKTTRRFEELKGITMKIKGIILAVTALVLLMSGILSGCGGAKPGTYTPSAAWAQDVVNKIRAIQPEDIPGTLAQEQGLKTGDEFDVNDYFPVFTHLSIKSGYVLDYFYMISGSGGVPLLYTRTDDQEPYKTFDDYMQDSGNITRAADDVTLVFFSIAKNEKVKYGSQISVSDSPEGYFEYTVLQLLGGQFYLFYKANQYDIRIVCQTDEVDKIIGEIDTSNMTPIDDSFKNAAHALDLQPVVNIGEDSADVSLVTFTKWGGFARVSFNISRDYPHSITKYVNENILKYDCGIKF